MRLVIDRVGKVYEGAAPVVALDGVSFSLGPGEFVALVGPSGCGKSTLLNIVAGLTGCTSGHVYFEGVQPGRQPVTAMVFQDVALFPWRTVESNIGYGLEQRGVPARARAEAVARLVRLVGLRGFERAYPHQLSGGMRQRAGLARALAVEPDVLLLDEPLSALDAQARWIMQEELQRIWEASRPSALHVTHNIEEAVFLADRVVVLSRRPGRVAAELRVDLGRPRTEDVLGDPRFVSYVREIWGLIKEQARAAFLEPGAAPAGTV